jgi:ligand-binding sensor domain-containing protein
VRSISALLNDAILVSTDEGLYFGTREEGNWQFIPLFNQFDQYKVEPLPFEDTQAFFVNQQNQVWVAADNGLGFMFEPFWENRND